MSSTLTRLQTPSHTYNHPVTEPPQPYSNHQVSSYSSDFRTPANHVDSYAVSRSALSFPNPNWQFLMSSAPRIFMIRDTATRTDLSLRNLKNLTKPLDMALACKVTVMQPPSLSLPDQLFHLPNFPTFHGTTGRATHLQTLTKPNEGDIVVQLPFRTHLRQLKYTIHLEINR